MSLPNPAKRILSAHVSSAPSSSCPYHAPRKMICLQGLLWCFRLPLLCFKHISNSHPVYTNSSHWYFLETAFHVTVCSREAILERKVSRGEVRQKVVKNLPPNLVLCSVQQVLAEPVENLVSSSVTCSLCYPTYHSPFLHSTRGPAYLE